MSKQGCTAAGFAAANAELQQLRSRGRFRQNAQSDGELSVEAHATQGELVNREAARTQSRIKFLEHFVATHTPVPPPTQFETIELGHPVTIVYLNKQGKELRKKYVAAGACEPEIYLGSDAMMLNINSPLGKLLLGKHVGDTFDVFLAGHDCEVRVEAISQLLVPDQLVNESSSSRLSINGSLERVATAA